MSPPGIFVDEMRRPHSNCPRDNWNSEHTSPKHSMARTFGPVLSRLVHGAIQQSDHRLSRGLSSQEFSKPSGLSHPQPQSNVGERSVSQHGQGLEPGAFLSSGPQEGLELTGPGAFLRRALSGTSLVLDHAMQDSAVNDVEPRFSDQCHASGGLV